MNVNFVNKVNVKSKVKNSYILWFVNDEFSLIDDEINFFKEMLVFFFIDLLSKLVFNNFFFVLFILIVWRNNNWVKMNVEFDLWICIRCCWYMIFYIVRRCLKWKMLIKFLMF